MRGAVLTDCLERPGLPNFQADKQVPLCTMGAHSSLLSLKSGNAHERNLVTFCSICEIVGM